MNGVHMQAMLSSVSRSHMSKDIQEAIVDEPAHRALFSAAQQVPFSSFNNKYSAGTCYIVGRGPTTFDYKSLADVTEPIFFINDAVCLEKFARSETFFFAHDSEMRTWLDGSMKSTAVLPVNGSILDSPGVVLGHTGKVIFYHREEEDRENLMRLSRDQLADAAALYSHSGTIHSLLHFIWFCGFSRVIYVGCDGINQQPVLASTCASEEGYDPRLQNRSNTAPDWNYTRIRRVQELLAALFCIETVYCGTPI